MTHTENIKKMPLVSVLMPCYNHGAYVGNAIESILNQTYPNIELIVADNGSTDNSFEVINQYKDKIRIFRLEKNNLKLCGELMRGAAKGEYIAQATSDDEWMPEKIEQQMEAFSSIPNLQICFTWALYADENMRVLSNQNSNPFLVNNRSRKEWLKRFIYAGNCLCYPSSLYKKEAVEYLVVMPGGYVQLEDYFQWVLIIQRGEIHIIEKPLVKFRLHFGDGNPNESTPSLENMIRTLEEQAEIILRTLQLVDDTFFIEAFKDEFIVQHAESHQEILCEKFFLLRRLAERSPVFSGLMLYFYHDHYLEMADILEKNYGFSSKDFKYLSARNGIAYLYKRLEMESMLRNKQKAYADYYINIAQELAREYYSHGFAGNTAQIIFHALPEADREELQGLYQVCLSTLQIIEQNITAMDDIYNSVIEMLLEVFRLMGSLRKQAKLLGIMCNDEEFELFGELVRLGKKNRLDLQEAIVPYIKMITGQLGDVIG